jgi:HAD superfamily hydrolase (TIGR01509 family)
MLRAVIWDFDGTICDTYPAIAGAINAALASFSVATSLAHVIALASTSQEYCIRTLATEFGVPYPQLDTIFHETYQRIRLCDQAPFPGLSALCKRLAGSNVLQCIVTHRRRESLLRLLSTHGLESYFTHIIAADDGFPRKPAPDAMAHVLATYAIAPADALVIGDRDVDILAGQAIGALTCLFRATFPAIVPTYSIWDYAELADIVAAITNGTPGPIVAKRG